MALVGPDPDRERAKEIMEELLNMYGKALALEAQIPDDVYELVCQQPLSVRMNSVGGALMGLTSSAQAARAASAAADMEIGEIIRINDDGHVRRVRDSDEEESFWLCSEHLFDTEVRLTEAEADEALKKRR